MRVAVGCDHVGVELKNKVIRLLEASGCVVTDKGTDSMDPVDYPDYGAAVSRAVAAGEADSGILICGTGVGMGITANKVPGIRAAIVSEPYSARMAREHNDANVLCFGARVVGEGEAEEIVRVWLNTGFLGGKHNERVEKLRQIEEASISGRTDSRG